MKSYLVITVSLVLSLAWGGSSWAEEKTVDLRAAVETALAHNPRLEQSRKAAEIAELGRGIALSAYLPHAHGALSAQRHVDNPLFPDNENYQMDLTFRQTLLDLERIAHINAATSRSDLQQEELRAFEQRLIFDTVRHFYGTLLAEEIAQIRKQALRLAEEELRIAQARYDEGLVSYYDLLRSETKYMTAQADSQNADSEHRKSLAAFKNTLGYSPGEKISPEGDFAFELDDPLLIGSLEESVEQNHPASAMAQHRIEQFRHGLSASQAEFFPSLDLEIMRSTAKHNRLTAERWGSQWAGYLKVSVPLFEGTGRVHKVRSARRELEQAHEHWSETVNEIKKDLDSFYRDHVAAIDVMKSQKKNYETSRELYDLVRERYVLGEASEIELLDAHVNLIDVESSYKQAQYRVIVSHYGMLLSAGLLDKEALHEN